MMYYSGEDMTTKQGNAWLAALRPALPAVIGAAALTFLFAAVIPMAWVAGISWNLYLDRLAELFVPPVGNGARLALALGMSAVASLIAAFVALLLAQPEESRVGSLRRRVRGAPIVDSEGGQPRRRADHHPDDPPRPPLRAGRDLPALGLGPVGAPQEFAVPETAGWPGADELVLADLAPVEIDEEGEAPWLQPVELAGRAMPDPNDKSLGAMVARFESGLGQRRYGHAATAAVPVPAMVEDAEAEIDFALEAALSTLQRMNRKTVG